MGESLTLGIRQNRRLCKTRLGLLSKGCDGFPPFQELLFGLSNQLDKDVTVPATASAKAPHDFFELLPQELDVALELGDAATALLRDVVDEL